MAKTVPLQCDPLPAPFAPPHPPALPSAPSHSGRPALRRLGWVAAAKLVGLVPAAIRPLSTTGRSRTCTLFSLWTSTPSRCSTPISSCTRNSDSASCLAPWETIPTLITSLEQVTFVLFLMVFPSFPTFFFLQELSTQKSPSRSVAGF